VTTDSPAVPGPPLDPPAGAPEVLSPTRLLYWSLRRELWENKSIYLAPLAVAGVVLFSYLVGTIGLPARLRTAAVLEPARQQALLAGPFSLAASVIMMTTIVVGAFYCLDALYGERRDRSILFWKSLPVSDLTTVLSKACIPLLVLPLVGLAVVVATQLLMLLLGTIVVLLGAASPAALWARVPLFRMSLVMVYGLGVHALWHAPLYAWLLLVSAWARRLPILWAVLPPLAIGVVERMAFGTTQFCALMRYRFMGTLTEAFDFKAQGGIVPLIQPLKFLGSPGLWSGLIVAAAFLALAVRLRRRREPI
jgi:ABC-2 type transport system permease protein